MCILGPGRAPVLWERDVSFPDYFERRDGGYVLRACGAIRRGGEAPSSHQGGEGTTVARDNSEPSIPVCLATPALANSIPFSNYILGATAPDH